MPFLFHEQLENTSRIVGIFHSHPIMLMGKWLIIFAIINVVGWSSVAFLEGVSQTAFLLNLFMIFMSLAVTSFIHWKLNIDILTRRRVVCMRLHGIFHFSIEDISLSQVKSVNAHQEGILQNIFSYGKIVVASEFHEVNSKDNNIILKNVWPIQKILKAIKRQVEIVQGENDD